MLTLYFPYTVCCFLVAETNSGPSIRQAHIQDTDFGNGGGDNNDELDLSLAEANAASSKEGEPNTAAATLRENSAATDEKEAVVEKGKQRLDGDAAVQSNETKNNADVLATTTEEIEPDEAAESSIAKPTKEDDGSGENNDTNTDEDKNEPDVETKKKDKGDAVHNKKEDSNLPSHNATSDTGKNKKEEDENGKKDDKANRVGASAVDGNPNVAETDGNTATSTGPPAEEVAETAEEVAETKDALTTAASLSGLGTNDILFVASA